MLAAAFGMDTVDNVDDKELFNQYFSNMLHKLDANEYYDNPYYKNIKIPTIKINNSELKYEKYKPFEGFVCNDIIRTEEGRQIPQVGFFQTEFMFPAVLENERIWMTITPNEIETMKEAVDKAFGNVLTFGLGLGYYAYMVSEKVNVESITVVEKIKMSLIYLINMYCHNSVMLTRSGLSKQMLSNMQNNICLRKNMILYLRIYGMMFLMEWICI